MRGHTGFTLIELIVIILILSIGGVGLSKMFSNANLGVVTAANVQVMSQHAQACAERVIGVRRDLGFSSANLNTTMCNPAPSGYARIVGMPATYIGTASTACPNGATCRDVTVTVCANADSPCSGSVRKSSIVQLLVQY